MGCVGPMFFLENMSLSLRLIKDELWGYITTWLSESQPVLRSWNSIYLGFLHYDPCEKPRIRGFVSVCTDACSVCVCVCWISPILTLDDKSFFLFERLFYGADRRSLSLFDTGSLAHSHRVFHPHPWLVLLSCGDFTWQQLNA